MLSRLKSPLRQNTPAKPSKASPVVRSRLLIIGNGMVGWKLCQALVARGVHRTSRITIIGDEPRPAYDRVRLTDYFNHRRADDLLLAPRSWYESNDLDLRTGVTATAIDRKARTVTLSSGDIIAYDRLVLATGSHPFVPPIAGRDHPLVHVYRTIEDLEAIQALAVHGRRAAVIGGGLLGLEAAKALLDLGVEATVIERGSGLMARQLTPDASTLLREKIEAIGVRIISGEDTRAVEPAVGGLRLLFSNGTDLLTDFLIIAAGIKPRDELARACDLVIGKRGGVEVDDFLTTSDPRIHALGECASHHGMIYGLVTPGYLMAEALADTLAGKPRRFTGGSLAARLKLLGVDVCSSGEFQESATSLVHRTADTYRELIFEGSRLVGALSVGPNPEAARCQDAVERRQFFWRWRREHFIRTGRLWSEAASSDPSLWPAEAIVCSCKGITRGALTAACRSGCTTADALAETTGASTVCGSCQPLVAQLAGGTAVSRPAAGALLLLLISLAAALVAASIASIHPLAIGQSVEHRHPWEFILLDTFWRQVTGFTMLGVAVFSLVLSLRKRIKRFTLGDFGWWRVIHSTLGTLGIVTLIAHTGLRLGSNFNLVLMLDFLGLILLGTGAGLVTAWEKNLAPQSALRLRRGWTWAHILLVWPLPVLVGFHVLAAYYY
ncbi:MAG TPA: FAD-dependent oxidoreductase [Rariglobus sp.]|nr:FAD-dependent oxidoreductase [Rariglobus sp.]